MPWEVLLVSEIRLAFVHQVDSLHWTVADACRKFGICGNPAINGLVVTDGSREWHLAVNLVGQKRRLVRPMRRSEERSLRMTELFVARPGRCRRQ
jgi:hypothetical protein